MMNEMPNYKEPVPDNLPAGAIDWDEISRFVETMLAPGTHCTKGWKMLENSAARENLQAKSIAVLEMLHTDLYEGFFRRHGDRFEIWQGMEHFIRAKYGGLSEKAVSRILATYHGDDR